MTINQFKRKVRELALLIELDEDIVIRRDNRLGGYSACVSLYLYIDTDAPVYLMRCNERKISVMQESEVINLIFHELGHMKYKHEYDKRKSLERMEYEAEKFALLNIKQYYPQYFKNICLNLFIRLPLSVIHSQKIT